MTKLTPLLVHATILLSLMFLASCGDGGSRLDGAWTCKAPGSSMGTTFVFKDDGTGTRYEPGRTEGSRFTWSVDGDQLALHNEGEDSAYRVELLAS